MPTKDLSSCSIFGSFDGTEAHIELKNAKLKTVHQPGIDPPTFRIVQLRLDHWAIPPTGIAVGAGLRGIVEDRSSLAVNDCRFTSQWHNTESALL